MVLFLGFIIHIILEKFKNFIENIGLWIYIQSDAKYSYIGWVKHPFMTHRQKVDAKIQDFLGGMGLTQDWM
jgi:hypothetical protein